MGGIHIKADSEIFVICDTEIHNNEHLLQIISKARSLADTCNKKVTCFCAGKYNQEQFRTVIRYGADHVILCEQDKWPDIRHFCDIAAEVINKRKPKVVLFPASRFGKEAAAVLSTRFEAGLTADCIDVEVDDNNNFYFSRAAINDSVIAKISCMNCNIMMCTVKKDVFKKKQCTTAQEGRIEKFYPGSKDEHSADYFEIIDFVKGGKKISIDINKYSVVFCIGRGVKTEDMRDRIFCLAKKCGAGVVGTRTVVEEHLIEKERQVGQSGKSIAPRIYVGFGVSGTSQHMVGIKNAGTIIAINNDEDAAIFDYADYSIIEDLNVVVEEMERILC